MQNFFDFWLWLFAPRNQSSDEETFSEWQQKRQALRAEHFIVHKLKSEWLFSGTIRNENGVTQDAGYLRSPTKMNRAQALKYFARAFPRGNILHVDDKNKIITYSF